MSRCQVDGCANKTTTIYCPKCEEAIKNNTINKCQNGYCINPVHQKTTRGCTCS